MHIIVLQTYFFALLTLCMFVRALDFCLQQEKLEALYVIFSPSLRVQLEYLE